MTDNSESDTPSRELAASDPGPVLSLDAVFELLANRSRRFVLYTLVDDVFGDDYAVEDEDDIEYVDGVTDLETIVEEVVTLEAAHEETAVRRERYLEVATDLYHWHLPVLADVGVVSYDDRHHTIRYRRHATLETWLRRIRRDEIDR